MMTTQSLLFSVEKTERRGNKRKSPDGAATNKLVFSAYQGTNQEIFPNVISLHVAPGSTVADVTFGKGVF